MDQARGAVLRVKTHSALVASSCKGRNAQAKVFPAGSYYLITEIFPNESPFLMSVVLINKATSATWDYPLSKINKARH